MSQRLKTILDLLCSVPSVSGSELRLAKLLVDWAKANGLGGEIEPLGGERASALIHLCKGEGPRILLSAHIDTLPLNPIPPSKLGLHGDRYYAPEVNNMKGALAAMLEALLLMRDRTFSGTITLLAAGSECDTVGLGTLHALSNGLTADHAINGEPTNLRVQSQHAGVFRMRLTASGVNVFTANGHADQNAIVALSRVIATLDTKIFRVLMKNEGVADETSLLLNIGTVKGGEVPSMLASKAVADIDLRVGPGVRIETVERAVTRYLRDRGHDNVSVSPIGPPEFMNPPAFLCDRNWAVTDAVMDSHFEVVNRQANFGAFQPEVFYGSDAPHLVDAGIPTCMYGPGFSGDIGSIDESISFRDVEIASLVYSRAIERLLADS